MTDRVTVYLLDPDGTDVASLRAALPGLGLALAGSSDSAIQAIPGIVSTCPSVVVIDLAACGSDPAAVVRKVATACPATRVIVTGGSLHAAMLSRAVAAGAHGFLLKPYAPEDLVATVKEALASMTALPEPTPARPANRGTLIAVYSPKGGVGCTTVATNVAVALASRKLRVGLVDLDLQWGDVGALLDLRSVNSIGELIGHDVVTDDLVNETFVQHASGLRALLAPETLSALDNIEPEQVVRVLDQLRRHFDVVICDLWSSFEELTRGVLRVADRVLLVITPELPALRSTQRLLAMTHADLHLEDKSVIVANRCPGKAGLSGADIAKIFGRAFSASIPSEGVGVTEAINRGLSVLDPRVHTKVAQHYRDLADAIVRPREPVPPLSGTLAAQPR